MKSQDHEKLIMKNITKSYQKVHGILEEAMNMKARNITKTYKLAERIDHLPKTETFITSKNRKYDFYNKLSCRLINSTKSKLWKISKKNNRTY